MCLCEREREGGGRQDNEKKSESDGGERESESDEMGYKRDSDEDFRKKMTQRG